MGMSLKARGGAKSDINITPYIDILLVLLIIFMVVTPMHQWDLDVRVPQPPPPAQPLVNVPADVIVVSIGESAELAINRIPTEIGELASKLREIYGARADKNLFISASPRLPYGDVVRVIDISKAAGVADIGLMSAETP